MCIRDSCLGLAHGEPRGLDVSDIAQYKAAHGDDAQVFQRREPCRYSLAFQFGARRPEDPRDVYKRQVDASTVVKIDMVRNGGWAAVIE